VFYKFTTDLETLDKKSIFLSVFAFMVFFTTAFLVGYCGIPQGHGFFLLWDFSKIENLSLKFQEMLVGWIGRRL